MQKLCLNIKINILKKSLEFILKLLTISVDLYCHDKKSIDGTLSLVSLWNLNNFGKN